MITGQFLEALACVSGVGYSGAYSRDKEKAIAYAKAHGGTCAWDSFDDMLASPEVTAVYIASPNILHKAQIKAALLAGKHVLAEKPLATNEQDARELFALAHKQGLILMEAMRLVHDPNYALLAQNVERVGSIAGASLSFAKHSSRYDELKEGHVPNIFNPRFGAGAMMDLGIYPIEAALFLFGTPQEVTGFSKTISVGKEKEAIDLAGAALCSYETFIASISYSKVATDYTPCSVYGECGQLFWEGVSQPKKIWFVDSTGSKEEIALIHGKNKTNHEVGNMEFEISAFRDAILEKKETNSANERTLLALKILEKLQKEAGINFPKAPERISL